MRDKHENYTIINIINKYDSLKKGLKHVILTNKSNNAPYHNLNHLLTVTRHCYHALDYMDMLKDDKAEALLMAALFHDYNHSMGKEKDDVNVKDAKKGLRKFIEDEKIDLDIDFMEKVLDATQYPYVIDNKNLDQYQSIIRDADLCQIYEYDWLKQNIFGLSVEMKIDVVDLLFGQRKFLEGIDPITKYGKYMNKTHFDDVMEEFTILEKIMS